MLTGIWWQEAFHCVSPLKKQTTLEKKYTHFMFHTHNNFYKFSRKNILFATWCQISNILFSTVKLVNFFIWVLYNMRTAEFPRHNNSVETTAFKRKPNPAWLGAIKGMSLGWLQSSIKCRESSKSPGQFAICFSQHPLIIPRPHFLGAFTIKITQL